MIKNKGYDLCRNFQALNIWVYVGVAIILEVVFFNAAQLKAFEIKLTYIDRVYDDKSSFSPAIGSAAWNINTAEAYGNLTAYGLSNTEINEVNSVVNDIRTGVLLNYSDFTYRSTTLSEKQKLLLINIIGSFIGQNNYGDSGRLLEQSEFYSVLQSELNGISSGNVGVCGSIHTYLERALNEIGIKSSVTDSVVIDSGHAITIVQTENNGIAIQDYGNIFLFETENPETALFYYESTRERLNLTHTYYSNGDAVYHTVTDLGKDVFGFLGYDSTSQTLHNQLNGGNGSFETSSLDLIGGVENSIELSHTSFFAKFGEIKGESAFLLDNTQIAIAGFKLQDQKVDVKLAVGYGRFNRKNNVQLQQVDSSNEDDFMLVLADAYYGENSETEGFHYAARMSYALMTEGFSSDSEFYYQNMHVGIGSRYTFNYFDGFHIAPFVLGQTRILNPLTNNENQFVAKIKAISAEATVGCRMGYLGNWGKFFLEPFYTYQSWDRTLGFKTGLKADFLNISCEYMRTTSDFEFAPDKNIYKIQASISPVKRLDIFATYEKEDKSFAGDKNFTDETVLLSAGYRF